MAAPQMQHEPAGNGFGLVHRVAQSPLGDLWLALDQRQGPPAEPVLLRYVALSRGATRDTVERVASAGRAAMSLRSELIVPVLGVLQPGPLAIAYQYIEAQPVSVLQSCARARELLFPVSIALRLTVDLLRATQAVHESWLGWPTEAPFGGLLPASVLVSRDGRTRLCDALVSSSALLQRGFDLSAAELAYRAPEQVYASTAPEPTSDVFIATILLWELLSGRRMLSGRKETVERKLLEHDLPEASADLRPDCRLSRGLQELVNSGLALDPNQRPSTPGAFATALERCGHEIASHEEVAAFVNDLVGPQLDRAALILRLALGYAAGADEAQLAAAAQADPAAAEPDLGASQPELGSQPEVGTPPSSDELTQVRPRESIPPPLPEPTASFNAAAPASMAAPSGGESQKLATAVARALERHQRASGIPPKPVEQREPRGTSLGLGATPQPPRSGPVQLPVQVQPVVPLMGSVPPLPLLRRRAGADGTFPPALGLDAQPPSSDNEQTVVRAAVRDPVAVRSYSPPEPVRLGPKRALLAVMGGVVLLIQLWILGLARAQRQPGDEDPRPPVPMGDELSWRDGPRSQNRGEPEPEPELSEVERPAVKATTDRRPRAAER